MQDSVPALWDEAGLFGPLNRSPRPLDLRQGKHGIQSDLLLVVLEKVEQFIGLNSVTHVRKPRGVCCAFG